MRVIFGKMKHFFGELHAASITLRPVWRALSNEGVASLKEPFQEQRLRIPYKNFNVAYSEFPTTMNPLQRSKNCLHRTAYNCGLG